MRETPAFFADIAEEIWNRKYRLRVPGGAPVDDSLDATFWRVAKAGAVSEKGSQLGRKAWAASFHDAICDFGFLPAGRILAGAGTGRSVTLFNCFVMGRIEDDLGSIFENVQEAALTMQQGGGIGHDFSTLRPKGALVRSIGAEASGPVSFMDVWNSMCRTIMSAGARRGAMMATMRCDHPDIEAFIDVKADSARLRNFNLSVLVTDAFMDAVQAGTMWPLVFDGKTYRTVAARALWDRIMRAAYDYAEPGVIFIDRINRRNNLAYCEEIRATNPCGEQPLPEYGACLLGSINLTQFIEWPFSASARLDLRKLEHRVRVAVRFLDNVIDISNYPLPAQRHEAKSKRRIGLGLTGLADALIMLGVRYGSAEAAALAGTWMSAIQTAAYLASAELAKEKGAFPLYDEAKFLASPNVALLGPDVRRAIAKHGIRNGCLTSIAPTGTISLFAGNVSSGVEPVFDFIARRRVLQPDGTAHEEVVEDYAHALYKRTAPGAPLTDVFVTVANLRPHDHLVMQAALQPYVDSAISKTINCPEAIGFEDFRAIYQSAFDLGLKGCAAYRPNPVTGAVLQSASAAQPEPAAPDEAAGVVGQRRLEAAAVSAPSSGGPVSSRLGDIVYMSAPLERDSALAGYTYKLKWPESDHAIYVTINDIERDGRRRPFEIFINTRNLEHYAWTVALTRMISAVFRRGGDVSFVAEELKAVFDPQGGRFMDGRYVPSLLAAIGEIIERHMVRIGFLAPREGLAVPEGKPAAADGPELLPEDVPPRPPKRQIAGRGRSCPRCASASFVKQEGCWICQECGFSRCG